MEGERGALSEQLNYAKPHTTALDRLHCVPLWHCNVVDDTGEEASLDRFHGNEKFLLDDRRWRQNSLRTVMYANCEKHIWFISQLFSIFTHISRECVLFFYFKHLSIHNDISLGCSVVWWMWFESADNGLVLTFYLRLIYVNVSELCARTRLCVLVSDPFYTLARHTPSARGGKWWRRRSRCGEEICANVKLNIFVIGALHVRLKQTYISTIRMKETRKKSEKKAEKESFSMSYGNKRGKMRARFLRFSLINWVIIN